MTTQPGQDGERPYGDGIYRPEVQPWDPAYPYPYGAAYGAPQGSPQAPSQGQYGQGQYGQGQYGQGQYGQGQYGQGQYAQGQYAQGQSAPADYGQYPPYYGQGYYPPGYPQGPAQVSPQAAARARRRGIVALGIGAVAAVTVVGVALATGTTQSITGSAIAAAEGSGSGSGSTTPGTNVLPNTTDPNGTGGNSGNGGTLPNGTGGNSGSSATRPTASTTQQVGVVDIYTVQKYNSAAAAGTGMVLTSDGEILTNNHVISGATSIRVTVVSTGKSYTAKVVGTVPTKDIALLKLENASGLKTINLGDSSTVKVGDAVTGVGNAGGVGGTPSAASGKVTELGRTITASDEDGSGAETLNGVIVTDAPIQSGDSGGPLYNAKDEVVGIDTAASTSGASTGFAIPINTALSIVAEIRKGVETSSVHIGYPGFLGISVGQSQTGGALVAGVLEAGPAAEAGITAGDVITRVGSTTISSSTQLQAAVSALNPGKKVSVTYTDDQTSTSRTVTVTLATGPAD